ncbi:Ppx/GppA phosphatase family protein [Flavobacterium hercynium]|uniref:Exopolyphosphatase n=1 Tax=Flavobacterium hercynium TaxID=387094 RepID=A0A226HH90_9FLAO|nr:exopolyphosphatase [Flavobacterium hercynium]OXA93502.1 exopolyphosphatase [Flavobacterium hercynium]SMP32100.1 Ppx/GppA phosphatase family protein [Flavobacterium hercynium]
MLKKNKNQFLIFFLLNLFFSVNSFAQKNFYAGIEIGRRAVKTTVLDVNNIKKAEYKIVYFSNDRIALADHIAATGGVPEDDIKKVSSIINEQLAKIRADYKIPEENIFIVAAPVFESARNIDALRNKITSSTSKSLDIISEDEEAKVLVKGAIPPADYANALLLDIGGQRTKGGYIDVLADNKLEFIPLELDFGTMTLTDAVKKSVANPNQANDMSTYQEKSFEFNTVLRKKVKEMVDSNPLLAKKDKIYLSGGAVWSFVTLYFNESVKEHFVPLTLEDVINYDAVLKNNFVKYSNLAKTNKEAESVLKIYDQSYLISANNILYSFLEGFPNLATKKVYFAKEGQITWLLSYVADRSKKVNTNF